MKIKKIISQHRRDFWADYECEFCGYVKKDSSGYDDSYFHTQVIPNMECPECGKNSNEVTSNPKYDDTDQLAENIHEVRMAEAEKPAKEKFIPAISADDEDDVEFPPEMEPLDLQLDHLYVVLQHKDPERAKLLKSLRAWAKQYKYRLPEPGEKLDAIMDTWRELRKEEFARRALKAKTQKNKRSQAKLARRKNRK